ncbi:DUF6268 family outer membrane beta-barrel protein [Tenacibaculum caenipelagi]|uniref:DUF6268 domain-containing protein n=1 Tax=Tenacibaculum caenipelagi TaxID=1325435 RepID=A0A4R6TA42_9FLAO|nr:DUF6268 family outer membrane beta-barrel protein [Tenacibaculum caenipelagi]TDQ23746.1 hypothetical protein DFQ07_2274 [Tenacibaculum caenipelagi]
MFRKKIAIIAVFLLGKTYGQVTGDVFVLNRDRDLFYVHYTPDISDNSSFDYQRLSGKLGFAPILFNKLAFYNTIGMDYHSIKHGENKPLFLRKNEDYYNVNYSLLAKYRITRKWSVNALIMPHLIGSFNDDIKSDDFKINGILFAEKRFNTKNRNTYYILSFGVGYLTLSGETMINPVVNIMGNINNKVSFAVGLPSTYVKYDFNNKHSVKLVGDLNDFTVRMDKPILPTIPEGTNVKRSVFTTASVGIEYNYWLTKTIGVMVRGTRLVFEKYEFQDSEDEYLFGFDVPSKSYLSVGVKINPFR